MSERKKDPSKMGLTSSAIEGQGTTTKETGKRKRDSKLSNNKQL